MNFDTYYYKVVLNVDDDVEPIQNYIEEQIENIIVNIYSTEDNKYIFFETDLQKNEVQQYLSDLDSQESIISIGSSSSFDDDKNMAYFTMIPEFLQNGQNFNNLIQSFLGFFKILDNKGISSILYCVRCQSSNDARRLIAFTREISFNGEFIFVDSNILNLPIMQVSPRNLDADYIQNNYDFNIKYSTVYDQLNVLVFDSLKSAESFSEQLNGTIFHNQLVSIRHFTDNTTYMKLEKYQIRIKISDLLQDQENKIEDIKKNQINRICYSNLNKFGKVLTFEYDKKNHVNVIFENENDAIKIVKNQKIRSQFVNNTRYICGFPPDMTKDSLKSLLAKSSIILNNIDEYVLEPSDGKDILTKIITFPIFKLHFSDIIEVDTILNKIKKINCDSFIPFSFRNKDDFKDNFNAITSNNTILISGLPNESSPSDVANLCNKHGFIKLFLHVKVQKNSTAIITFSKASESENARKHLNQVIFHGNKLIVKRQIDPSFDFNLIKKSTFDQKKQQISQKIQNQNELNKKGSKQANKIQDNQTNIKNQNNLQSSQQSVVSKLSNPIKVEKSGEAQKQIKLEYNKFALLEKLKLEPLPPRIQKKETLLIIPSKLESDDSDDNDYTKEQKPDFI